MGFHILVCQVCVMDHKAKPSSEFAIDGIFKSIY